MNKFTLMVGVAAAALAATPALAQDEDVDFTYDIEYENDIRARMVTNVRYDKDVDLTGTVDLDGQIRVDSSAVAVIDNKQALDDNRVTFREETRVDSGASGTIDDDGGFFGNPDGNATGDDGLADDQGDGVLSASDSDVGFFSPIINDVGDLAVTGAEGNTGVNAAAGYYNQQENVAVIASSEFDDGDDTDNNRGGWAEAAITAGQGQTDNYYGPNPNINPDTGPENGENDFRDRNIAGAPTVTGGAGNIGVNVAAGAFNQQKNALAIAVATNASLAEATAAVIQAADDNRVVAMDSQNLTGSATIAGSAGNVGVNIAAGVGNQQMNSLTIAASFAGGGGGGTPTPTPTPTPGES